MVLRAPCRRFYGSAQPLLSNFWPVVVFVLHQCEGDTGQLSRQLDQGLGRLQEGFYTVSRKNKVAGLSVPRRVVSE